MEKVESKQLIDFIRNFFPKLFYSIYDLLRVLPHLKCIKRYEIIRHGKILKILGNGSTLRSMLEENFQDGDYMVVNSFVNSEYFCRVKPMYYVVTDRAFWNSQIGMAIFDKINQIVRWEMYLFVPDTNLCRKTKEIILNPNVKLLYFSPREYRGFDNFKYFLYKYKLANPAICNVLIPSIMTGIHLDYPVIELYGVEHSWIKYLIVKEDNVLYSNYPHFYEDGSDKYEKVVDSFGRNVLLHQFLLTYSKVFATYFDINTYIKRYKYNVKIINKSKGSYIQAFSRE